MTAPLRPNQAPAITALLPSSILIVLLMDNYPR